MSNLKEIEKEALGLPLEERERLVLTMWDSLECTPAIDPEGIEVALHRDEEIETGFVQPIIHSEFRRCTSDS